MTYPYAEYDAWIQAQQAPQGQAELDREVELITCRFDRVSNRLVLRATDPQTRERLDQAASAEGLPWYEAKITTSDRTVWLVGFNYEGSIQD